LSEEGKYKEALPLVEKAIFLKPAQAYYLNNKGYILLQLGKLDEAKETIEHSLRIESENAFAIRNLGLYFQKKGDTKSQRVF
jgi:Flp pilus assembly protein TadD